MSEVVLDASALLALLNGEPAADLVAEAITGAAISAVNLSEVAGRLAEDGVPPADVREALNALGLQVIPFDLEQAYEAAWLRPQTKAFGLSLGDRACIQLARRMGRLALTTDRVWSEMPSLLGPVRVIR